MATLDVFNSDAFSTTSLTAAVEKSPFQPSLLGDMGIFEDVPVRTTSVFIEERSGVLGLIPTDARGNPPRERQSELRTARSFQTVRLAMADTLTASEIQGIRAFGSETELMQVQAEIARRTVGATGIQRQIEYTLENHRLGAVQGKLVDADGSTVLYDWAAQFGITPAAEVAFDLTAASPVSGAVRKKCTSVIRAMQRAAQGVWLPSTQVVGLCGDAFFDDLIANAEVRSTYLNWQDAQALRGNGNGWNMEFAYGGIRWVNYRGSDDNSTVAVPTDKVKFFPLGAPGVFQVAWAPHDSFDFVNTLGKKLYAGMILDRDRNSWVKIEMYSYPLHYCTRPAMLLTGRRGS
jgi:hypothetical protein